MASHNPNTDEVLPEGVELYDPADAVGVRQRVFKDAETSLRRKFPFEYGNTRMELVDLHYADPEEYDIDRQKKALMSNRFLNRRLRGRVRLIDTQTGDELDQRELTLMRVPYITDRGTIIHNGNEYTVLSQARLRPGVYSRRKQSDDIETQFNVKHGTGRAFRLRFEPKTSLYKMDIGTSTKVSLYSLLKDLGYPDSDIRKSWGDAIFDINQKAYDPKAFGKAYKHIVGKKGKATDVAGQRQELLEAFQNSLVEESVVKRNLPNFNGFFKAGSDSETGEKAARDNEDLSYGCLMLQLPYKLKEKILDWATINIDQKKLGEFGLELTPHITVLYGFPKNFDAQNILPLIADRKFSFELGKISKFGNDDDVIKISIKSDSLRWLHHAAKKRFGITSTYPTYKPHITLAYVKSGSHDHLLNSDYFLGEKYEYDEFVYSPANGGPLKKLVAVEGSNRFKVKDAAAGESDALADLREQFFKKYYNG